MSETRKGMKYKTKGDDEENRNEKANKDLIRNNDYTGRIL